LTVTYAGFVNGENATVLGGTLVISRAAGENVGTYVITASGLTSGNYAITFNTGILTITKVPLAITADDKTKPFGTPDPAFTVAYSGFVNGETVVVLGGTLVVTRVSGEAVGRYAITPSGLTSGNYLITFNAGTLTITATAPTILSLTRSGAANVLVTWSSLSNATYRVQFKSDLTSANWTDLAGDVLASSSTASKLDILTSTHRYYRIQVVP
jgi:hypothetical protein